MMSKADKFGFGLITVVIILMGFFAIYNYIQYVEKKTLCEERGGVLVQLVQSDSDLFCVDRKFILDIDEL